MEDLTPTLAEQHAARLERFGNILDGNEDPEVEPVTATDEEKSEAEAEEEGEEIPAEESEEEEGEEAEPEENEEEAEEAEEEPDQESLPDDYLDRKVVVKLSDGTEAEVPVRELKLGYLRQGDYTRKTQELAEARRQFEAEYSTFGQQREEQKEAVEFSAWWKANPALAQIALAAIEEARKEGVQVNPVPQETEDPRVKQLEERLDEVEKKRVYDNAMRELRELRQEFPDLTKEELQRITDHAVFSGTLSPRAAFLDIYPDRIKKAAKREAARETVRKAKEGKRASTPSKGTTTNTTPSLSNDPRTRFFQILDGADPTP